MNENIGEPNYVGAVERSLAIVEVLKEQKGAGITEIASELDISKASVYNHLATLEKHRYVTKDSQDQYHLGFRYLNIAYFVRSRVPIYDLVVEEVDKLAEQSEELVVFTVEQHGIGVCLYKAEGEKAVQTDLYEGHEDHLHHTAVGKAILAHLPPDRVDEILDRHGLPAKTKHTITDREELLEELEDVRESGVAFNHQETIRGLVGVGVPLTTTDGGVIGAISIIGPRSRLTDEYLEGEFAQLLSRSTNIIEINSTSLLSDT